MFEGCSRNSAAAGGDVVFVPYRFNTRITGVLKKDDVIERTCGMIKTVVEKKYIEIVRYIDRVIV